MKQSQPVERISPAPDEEPLIVTDEIGATCQRIMIKDVRGDDAEALSDVLLGLGVQSVVVSEHQRGEGEPEQKLYDFDAPLWNLCDLDVHISLEEDPSLVMGTAQEAMEAMESDVKLTWSSVAVENQEWVAQIKDSYVPLQITNDLFIIPEWSQLIDPDAKNIFLQPGVAFGTGEHPTTRCCLIQIQRWGQEGLLNGKTVMDYGAGSGVLAIAALLYGASCAIGTDTDALAVRAATRNAQLNGLGDRMAVIQCTTSSEEDQEPLRQAMITTSSSAGSGGAAPIASIDVPPFATFDIVCSNILRGPLIDLQPRLSSYMSSGGHLLLSGILESQADEIIQAYQEDFQDFKVAVDNGWACITAVKK